MGREDREFRFEGRSRLQLARRGARGLLYGSDPVRRKSLLSDDLFPIPGLPRGVVDPTVVSRFHHDLLRWANSNLREFPWRSRDASFYEVFIAEFFLTQTPAENVVKVYDQFIETYPKLADLNPVQLEELKTAIEPIGFQNRRARALKQIAGDHAELPTSPAELRELKRVGDYVANATVCFALGRPLPIVDRNVERVYERLLGIDWPSSVEQKLKLAKGLLPDANVRTYNLALLDFGAAICGPAPRCSECFARRYCAFYRRERLARHA